MSFYQNPFFADFKGNLVLADRQYSLTFDCPLNAGRGLETVVAWGQGPYNLSGNDLDGNPSKNLVISYSTDQNSFLNWGDIAIDVTATAANNAAVMPSDVVAALNANTTFNSLFCASLNNNMVTIKQTMPTTRFKFYIVNGTAEEFLAFNSRAGVAELPTYFDRHSIANRFNFPDSVGMLVLLNPSVPSQAALIDNARDKNGKLLNYSHSTIQPDWALLGGRSGLFQFTKVAGSTSIIYPAGAKVGDLAMMVVAESGNTFQMPYTLTAGDLITP